MKFELKAQHIQILSFTDRHPGTKINMEFEAEHIDNVLDEFAMFLRGCGYIIDGRLDVVSHDE